MTAVATLALPKTRRPALARLGDFLRTHRRGVLALQWLVVAFYAVLIVVPPLLPLPRSGARILSHLTLFAQFAFWGIWWPFVIASTMLFGRAWCGLFCPEGTLTEFASRHGLGRAIPRWMRWGGWPFTAFALTTIYGQLVSVYEYPQAVLLVLGGSTLAAVVVGFVYGRASACGAGIFVPSTACSHCSRRSRRCITVSTRTPGNASRHVRRASIAHRSSTCGT